MPEAILLQDVETLGEQGTVVDVSKGYLRNYLIPRKLAQPATHGRARGRAGARRRPSARSTRRRARRRRTPRCSTKTVLTIPQQAGADGRLFGSVTGAGHRRRDPRGARPERSTSARSTSPEPIKNVGTYMVVVEVADGVTATVKTMVVARIAD